MFIETGGLRIMIYDHAVSVVMGPSRGVCTIARAGPQAISLCSKLQCILEVLIAASLQNPAIKFLSSTVWVLLSDAHGPCCAIHSPGVQTEVICLVDLTNHGKLTEGA